jgi:hypothetical protein
VDLGAGLGDRHHVGSVACHVLRHIGDDGEGGNGLETILSGGGQCRRDGGGDDDESGKQTTMHQTLQIRTVIQ